MKLVGDQPETVNPQPTVEKFVPLFIVVGFCLLAVGFVLIYKFYNRMKKSTEVEDGGLEQPSINLSVPPLPADLTSIAADHSFDNDVFEPDPPSYNNIINCYQTVIN